MFGKQYTVRGRCTGCGEAIPINGVYFSRYETGPAAYMTWCTYHPRCALPVALDDVAQALRTSSVFFEGRAQLEAEVHSLLERSRYVPRSFEADVARAGAEPTAEMLAKASLSADRPVESIGIVVHEQWAAGRLLESVHDAIGGLHLRTPNRGYGFVRFGDDLPDHDVNELQRAVRAFVVFVPMSGSNMPPMNRALWGIRASGIPVIALWIVGESPVSSPARDRREREAREALDSLGLPADLPPVVHATKVDRAAVVQLGEALDEAFAWGVAPIEHPADVAVRMFEWLASERRWTDAARALETAWRRNGSGPVRASLVAAAILALPASEPRMTALQILSRARAPSSIDPLYALLRSLWEPGQPPGPTVVLLCEMLADLGDSRFAEVAWDGYLHAIGALREDLETLVARGSGGDLLASIEQRKATLSQDDPRRAELDRMLARVRRRTAQRAKKAER